MTMTMTMTISRATILLAVWLTVWPVAADAAASVPDEQPPDNTGLGVLQLHSFSPAQSLRDNSPLALPGDIHPGLAVRAGVNWVNIWTNEQRYLLDFEMADAFVALSYGLTPRLAVRAAFSQRDYFGGRLDTVIENFHSLFNIDQDGRDRTGSNLEQVVIYDAAGNSLLRVADADEMDNKGVSVSMQRLVLPGTRTLPAVCLNVGCRYAFETIFAEGTALDGFITVGVSKRLSPWWLIHGAVGYTRYGSAHLPPVVFRSNILTGMAALAWQPSRRWTMLLQYQFHEGVVEQLGELSANSHEVNLGIKWRIGEHTVMEVGLIENIVVHGNSPDFGLHTAVRWRF